MNLGSIRDKLTGHKSQKSLYKKNSKNIIIENKIKLSKINNKDLEQIRDLNVNDLKKRYSITGSKLKLLGGMVTDYKEGQLSLSEPPGIFSKKKKLDKERLNQMLKDYDTAKKKRDLEEVQKNADDLKKNLVKSKSKRRILDKMVEDLHTGKISKAEIFKNKLDPKKMSKEQINKFLLQYVYAQKLNRGISFMISRSKLSFIPSIVRLQDIFEDLKGLRLSDLLSTIKR